MGMKGLKSDEAFDPFFGLNLINFYKQELDQLPLL